MDSQYLDAPSPPSVAHGLLLAYMTYTNLNQFINSYIIIIGSAKSIRLTVQKLIGAALYVVAV